MQQGIELRAPSWATSHEDIDGGVSWECGIDVELDYPMAGSQQREISVTAMTADQLTVTGGAITLVRSDNVNIHVEVRAEEITLSEARKLADALIAVVDAVEGA